MHFSKRETLLALVCGARKTGVEIEAIRVDVLTPAPLTVGRASGVTVSVLLIEYRA